MNKRKFNRMVRNDLRQNGNVLGLCEVSRDENSIYVVLDHVMGSIGKDLDWNRKPNFSGKITLQPFDTVYHCLGIELQDEKLGLQFKVNATVLLINHAFVLTGRIVNTNDGLSMHSLRDGRYVVDLRTGHAQFYEKLQNGLLKPENWVKNSDGSSPLSQKVVDNICEAFPQA